MEKSQDNWTIDLIERQILEHPWAVKVFLYILVPALAGLNVYCLSSGKLLAGGILTLELFGFLVVLISIHNTLPDHIMIRIFRYSFRSQLLFFALYLLYAIGILQQFEIWAWTYLFIFLLSLWMPNRAGTLLAIMFNLVLLFLVFWPDPKVFMNNSEYLIRFICSLAMFSLLSYCGVMVRNEYLKNLFQAQSDLEISKQEYRNLSQRLLEEIAHRDRIEKKLHHAIKMETVGKVAAGVAHDLNNILSGIVTYPDLILVEMKKHNPLRGPIERIKDSGIKAAAIVDNLLTLSRRGVPVSMTMDLRQVTEKYFHSPEYKRLRYTHARAAINTQYEDGPLLIKGSPAHLTKTLMILVSNAVEAMPGGGEVLLRLQAKTLDRPEVLKIPIQGQPEIPKGRYVMLSIRDTGIGIEAQEIESIFEPFYTKKVLGRSGTGLSMALVFGTVNDHNGFIQVDSVVEKGTLISIFFPVAPGDPKPLNPSIPQITRNRTQNQ